MMVMELEVRVALVAVLQEVKETRMKQDGNTVTTDHTTFCL